MPPAPIAEARVGLMRIRGGNTASASSSAGKESAAGQSAGPTVRVAIPSRRNVVRFYAAITDY
jgi:hypothetical protein